MKELKIFKTTPNFHDSFFKGPPLYLNYENNIFGSYKKQFKESCSYKYFQFPNYFHYLYIIHAFKNEKKNSFAVLFFLVNNTLLLNINTL